MTSRAHASRFASLVLLMFAVGRTAFGSGVELVSSRPDGVAVGGVQVAIPSADGRFVVFTTSADGTIPTDSNGTHDVYRRDLRTGVIECVSVDLSGNPSGGQQPDVSANGRFVTFLSEADDLATNQPSSAFTQIFRRDMQNGVTVVVSKSGAQLGNGASQSARISENGSVVVFASTANNLVANDTNGVSDVFRWTGSVSLVSVDANDGPANGASSAPDVDGDGDIVAFVSEATDLVSNDGNALPDVFVRFIGSNSFTAHIDPPGAAGADGASRRPSLSADGAVLVFETDATNFVTDDTNGVSDIVVVSVGSSSFPRRRISLATNGAAGSLATTSPRVSADGRFVTFLSASPEFGATDAFIQAWLHDRETFETTRLSSFPDGRPAAGDSFFAAPSERATRAAFVCGAAELTPTDTNGVTDAFVQRFVRMDVGQTIEGDLGQIAEPVPLEVVGLKGMRLRLELVAAPGDARIEATLLERGAPPRKKSLRTLAAGGRVVTLRFKRAETAQLSLVSAGAGSTGDFAITTTRVLPANAVAIDRVVLRRGHEAVARVRFQMFTGAEMTAVAAGRTIDRSEGISAYVLKMIVEDRFGRVSGGVTASGGFDPTAGFDEDDSTTSRASGRFTLDHAISCSREVRSTLSLDIVQPEFNGVVELE